MRKTLSAVLATASVVAAGQSGSASVIVDLDPGTATDTDSQTADGSARGMYFEAEESFTLDKIGVFLNPDQHSSTWGSTSSFVSDELTIELRDGASATLLRAATHELGFAAPGSAPAFYDFDITDIELTAGETYSLWIRAANGDAILPRGEDLPLYHVASPIGIDGIATITSGGLLNLQFGQHQTHDYAARFRLIIPEPAVGALMAAVVPLLRRRR